LVNQRNLRREHRLFQIHICVIKIVADRKSGRVLGSQIVGGEGVKERIDLIALALLLRADIRDLASYDACYVPPASPLWEPVNIAASQAAKRL
jgi:pyruvate/2-oxoglutarate dehydrogenase complex dihydrolipoamide dehydrogenase (E3) component